MTRTLLKVASSLSWLLAVSLAFITIAYMSYPVFLGRIPAEPAKMVLQGVILLMVAAGSYTLHSYTHGKLSAHR